MDPWVTAERTHEGFPLYLRRPVDVDTADNRRDFPTLALITREFRERLSDGRPDRDYNDSLADFHHDIITAFDADHSGVPVLVETFGGKRHYYFYVSPAADVGSIVSHIGASYPAEPLSWETRRDERWSFLDRYAKDFFQNANQSPLMKTTLSFIICAVSCMSASADAGLPGQTLISDGVVEKDVTADLLTAEKALAGDCKRSRIVDTRITKPPKTLAQERGTGLAVAQWTERWAVDRCGKKVFYIIHFDMRGSAGTIFKIEAPSK